MALAPTTDEYWDWDGTSLNQPYWNTSSFGGSRQDLPLLRGQNYAVAYRAGQMWRSKQPDQRPITIAMWAAGIDQVTGQPASDQRLAFNNAFQQLRSLFWKQGVNGSELGFLTRRWYLTQNGSTALISATAQAEIAGTMEPAMSGRTKADFAVDFLLADPYFYGTQQSQTLALSTPSVITNLGDGAVGFGQSPGNGGVPFTITLSGPLTNPVLTNQTHGVSVSVAATIASGAQLTLDVMEYTAYDNSRVSYLGVVSHMGARPWMLLLPGDNTLELTADSGSGDARITWQPPYL